MKENDFFKEHPDLNHLNNIIEEGWHITQQSLSRAASKLCGVTIKPGPGFWPEYTEFLSAQNPEVAGAIMDTAEGVNEKLRKKAIRRRAVRSFGQMVLREFTDPFGLNENKYRQ